MTVSAPHLSAENEPGARERSRGSGLARVAISVLVALGILLALALPAVSQGAGCPNEQLRENARASNVDPTTGRPYDVDLPDCRAYEQVSPAEKEGGSGGVLNFDYPQQASGDGLEGLPMRSMADGSAITYTGEPFFRVPIKDLSDESLSIEYLSTRTPGSWETASNSTLSLEEAPSPVLPPLTETNGYEIAQSQVLEETPDGSKDFFLDERALMPGISNPAPGEPDLYEYTAPSPSVPLGRLEDLTTTKAGHADARGILGVGGEGPEEGSYVYFVAGGILAQGGASGGCGLRLSDRSATGTGCNLYLDHDGTTTYLATLPAGDESGFLNQLLGGIVGVQISIDWPSLPFERTAEVSPNGRYLAFGSFPLSTGTNQGVQIYRYDARATEDQEPPLVCVSCGCGCTGTAAPPPEALLPSSPDALINGADRQRSVLDDGRVFFTTAGALVPQDVNRQADVYEWEDGASHLISGGKSEAPAVFADASANGSDAFFTTSQSLVPSDQDEITDMYDAREGGGLPAQQPTSTCAIETACPGSVPAPPTVGGAPASATIVGTEGPPANITIKSVEKQKPPTRGQKLAKALKACHGDRNREKRIACETSARKRYGPVRGGGAKRRGRRG
jgi:hypothetical protein